MKTYRVYYSTGVNWKCEAVSLRRVKWLATFNQSYACRNDIGWRYRRIEIYEHTPQGLSLKAIKINNKWKKEYPNMNTGA
jgi:hypothetical protein